MHLVLSSEEISNLIPLLHNNVLHWGNISPCNDTPTLQKACIVYLTHLRGNDKQGKLFFYALCQAINHIGKQAWTKRVNPEMTALFWREVYCDWCLPPLKLGHPCLLFCLLCFLEDKLHRMNLLKFLFLWRDASCPSHRLTMSQHILKYHVWGGGWAADSFNSFARTGMCCLSVISPGTYGLPAAYPMGRESCLMISMIIKQQQADKEL